MNYKSMFQTDDDNVTLCEFVDSRYMICVTKPYSNERLGDYSYVYTCVDNSLLKIKFLITDIVHLKSRLVEVVGVVSLKGSKRVFYE